jgi:peptidoglycan/xylan/chitin deacetylase (PgdA/CDA1 family)
MLIFLVYHRVQDSPLDDFRTVTPEDLLNHTRTVREKGVPIIDPKQLGAGAVPQRGVVFTFDDGTTDHARVVAPLLERLGIPALFYVPTGRLDAPGYATHAEVAQLHEAGHTIGSHAHTHRPLPRLDRAGVQAELANSAEILWEMFGTKPVHFAPPGGLYDSTVVATAQQVGYQFFRTMEWGYNCVFDPMRIRIVPMTQIASGQLLAYALADRGESLLRFAFFAKNAVRTLAPHYTRARNRRPVG